MPGARPPGSLADAVDLPVPPPAGTRPPDPGNRPLAWQAAQWRVYFPFSARALALQGSHPTVVASLLDHSNVFDDPFGRIQRTTAYAVRLLYGDDLEVAAAELRRLHQGIAGIGLDGRPYHAWERDVWTWVHLTTAEALLYALGVSCGPLPRAEVEAFYTACRRTGVLYGVRDEDMPASVAGLRAYVDAGIRTRLRPNPGTERLRRVVLTGDVLGSLPAPPPVRRALGTLVAVPARVLLFGAFPEEVRAMWRVRWSVLDERAYATALLGGRALALVLPERARMLPSAYRALHAG